MPLGLYTSCEVSAPCGLCSTEGIIGLLDVPETYLEPDRMKAGLIWFTRGFLEYQFPNNAKLAQNTIEVLEFALELSSEVPGTSADWPSDITLSVNGTEIGTWTSPGDFWGQARRLYAGLVEAQGQPVWQAQELAGDDRWYLCRRDEDFTDLVGGPGPGNHHSIRLRIAVKPDAKHPGGINIFGRGYGNYDQEIIMRLQTER
ncbi:hypothetical protein BVRB_026700 [Beta vulgaris subsp. vulgaris]|uniref:Uncharacterized protein n=1 Tax=Beta vulgaris subsp. vulgaris TaxID=3555 RepID=A0A0J8AYN2_BETVV|nr:hypothetical protein BVRB_026700 [Beta vulgaris subsp. vulgaris]